MTPCRDVPVRDEVVLAIVDDDKGRGFRHVVAVCPGKDGEGSARTGRKLRESRSHRAGGH
jgi:nitrate reductase beta subunit